MYYMYCFCLLLIVLILFLVIFEKHIIQKYKKEKCLSDKYLEMFLLIDKWMKNMRDRKKISDYLKENKYENIIIYGMSYLGRQLYEELIQDGINIKYLVDRKEYMVYADREVKNITDQFDSVDVVIVTAIYDFDELVYELGIKFECPVLSLSNIIYKM